LDQRPWLVVSKFELSEEPQPDKDFIVTFWIVNSGKTPALNVNPDGRVSLWVGLPPPEDFAKLVGVRTKAMIPPGAAGGTHFSWPFRISRAQVDAYTAGVAKIYAEALINYTDAFATGGRHWTKVCASHASGRPLGEFSYCDQGNDVDRQ
jgi:hypothetical protein